MRSADTDRPVFGDGSRVVHGGRRRRGLAAIVLALVGVLAFATALTAAAEPAKETVRSLASAHEGGAGLAAVAGTEAVSDVDAVIVLDVSGPMEEDTLCYGCWEPISTTLYPGGTLYPLHWSDFTTLTADHCANACGEADYVPYDGNYEVNDCNYRHLTYTDTYYIVVEAEEYSQLSTAYEWAEDRYYTFWVIQRNETNAWAREQGWDDGQVNALGRDARGGYVSHHPFADYTVHDGLGVSCTWADLNGGEECRSGLPGAVGPFPAPRADYDIYAPREGDYYVWVRGQGGYDSGNQHLFWGMDTGGTYVLGRTDSFSTGAFYDGAAGSRWSWHHLGKGEGGDEGDAVHLVTGTHTLRLWAGGAGFDVDRIIITTDGDATLTSTIQSEPPNNGRTNWACAPCDSRFAGRPGGQAPPEGPFRPDCHVGPHPDRREDPIYDDEQPIRDALQAAKRLVGGLDPQSDQVGYVPFSTTVRIASELQCLQRLGAISCTAQVITDTVIAELERTRAGGARDMAGGIKSAIEALSTTGGHYGRPGAAKVMMLLTNGQPDAYPDSVCWQSDLWHHNTGDEQIDRAKDCVIYYAQAARDNGIVIHTVSLAPFADQYLMQAVADLTGGRAEVSPWSDELDGVFAGFLDREAGFEASPVSGVAPLAVAFANTSTGDTIGSLWTFGDGATSAEISPTHVCTAAGTYTVTLTVGGLGGPRALTRTQYITVTSFQIVVDQATGDTLVYTGTQGITITLLVPPGAVTETTTLFFKPAGTAAPPAGFVILGEVFELYAYRGGDLVSSLAFSVPVTITLQYSEGALDGLNEGTLALGYWAGSAWEDAACGPYARSTDGNWLSVPICHLGRFAFLGRHTVYLPLVLRQFGG